MIAIFVTVFITAIRFELNVLEIVLLARLMVLVLILLFRCVLLNVDPKNIKIGLCASTLYIKANRFIDKLKNGIMDMQLLIYMGHIN